MKKTLAVLALGAILIPAAVLAGGHYGDHRGEKRIGRMTEELQLSDQQRAEIEKIFQAQQEQRRALREQTREQIGNVLTPEQKKKWEQHMEERRQHRCDHDGKGYGRKGSDKD